MKHRIPLAAASLAVLGSVLVSAPAHAEDTRRCVSAEEYHSIIGYARDHDRYPARSSVERHWEVGGLGRPTDIEGFGGVTAYPRCGLGFDPTDPDAGEGYAAVWTDRQNRVRAVIWYREAGARIHGRP